MPSSATPFSTVPLPEVSAAAGASTVVNVPRLSVKPCSMPSPAMYQPTMTPALLMPTATVPWPDMVPAPGTSIVVYTPFLSRKPCSTPDLFW